MKSEMYFEAVIKPVCGCIWGPRLSQLRDIHRDRDLVSLEIHL